MINNSIELEKEKFTGISKFSTNGWRWNSTMDLLITVLKKE